MGALKKVNKLTWECNLSEDGYTVWEIVDQNGVRWGWIINAANPYYWTAHVGDFGQAESIDATSPPVRSRIRQDRDLPALKNWIEVEISTQWAIHCKR